MNQSRCGLVIFTLAVLALSSVSRADDRKDKKKPEEKWLIDRSLMISPQPATRPAFKYRLLPMTWSRKPGNAVPIYLRLVHEQNDASRRRWFEGSMKYNELALDRLPLDEVRKFLKDHKYMLRQLELGARRHKAEWNYTFEAGDPISLRLPDAQTMRGFAPLLVLQTRLALAERDYPAAIRTLETGFCLSQHVAEAPFLISSLVSIALSAIFTNTLFELVEQPDAPNLYWALTALPRPLVSIRKGEEFEQAMVFMQFPDLADLDRERTPAEWDAKLKRVRQELERLLKLDKTDITLPKGTTSADPANKSPDLAIARKYLSGQRGLTADKVKEMPPSQVLLLAMAGTFREFSDDIHKASFLPYPRARLVVLESDKHLKTAPRNELTRLAIYLLPGLSKILSGQNRLDRQIAALRTIEALRMHAAAHDGKLPDKLSDVTVVPIPDDPGTGKPFTYKRDGAKATLSGTIPGDSTALSGLRIRLTIRAK